jgi:hypothetical protein
MQTINVAGGNLYQIALQYLGAADQWNRIAQQNDLIDPMIVGVQSLQIPSVNANAGGGIFVPE